MLLLFILYLTICLGMLHNVIIFHITIKNEIGGKEISMELMVMENILFGRKLNNFMTSKAPIASITIYIHHKTKMFFGTRISQRACQLLQYFLGIKTNTFWREQS